MSTLADVDTTVLKTQLNAIAQEINSVCSGPRGTVKTKEAGRCVQNFIQFFELVAEEHGTHPQFLLGQQVCCNAIVLVLDRIVKPSLTQYCDTLAKRHVTRRSGSSASVGNSLDATEDAKARRVHHDVVRPFRLLLQTLHKNLIMEPSARSATGVDRDHEGHGSVSALSSSVAVEPLQASSGGAPRAEDPTSSGGITTSSFTAYRMAASRTCGTSLSVAPMLWKNAAPLIHLCQHLLDVLQNDVLVAVVGAEYATMVLELLLWDGYVRHLPYTFIMSLTDRLLTLLERAGFEGDATNERGALDGDNATGKTAGVSFSHSSLDSLSAPPTMEAATIYASLLAQVFLVAPITVAFASLDTGNDTRSASTVTRLSGARQSFAHTVKRLVQLCVTRHQRPTHGLRLEMHCVCALKRLVVRIQHDHPDVAREPLDLVKRLSDFFFLSQTARKDGWRLEVLEFISVELCLNFSTVLGSQVLHDIRTGFSTDNGLESRPPSDARHTEMVNPSRESPLHTQLSPRIVLLLHESVLPMAWRLFGLPRHDYSFVSQRELLYFPCAPLQDVFHFGAIVVYLACITHQLYVRQKELQVSKSEEGVDDEMHGEGSRIHLATVGSARSMRHAPSAATADVDIATSGRKSKRPRVAWSDPTEVFLDTLRSQFYRFCARNALSGMSGGDEKPDDLIPADHSSGASSEAKALPCRRPKLSSSAVQGLLTDSALFMLHLTAQPLTTLHFTSRQCDELVEVHLEPLLTPLGIRLGTLLMAALRAVAPRCSPRVQQRLFDTVVRRIVSTSGDLSQETGKPNEVLYDLLSTLAERATLGGWLLLTSTVTRGNSTQAYEPVNARRVCGEVAAPSTSVREETVNEHYEIPAERFNTTPYAYYTEHVESLIHSRAAQVRRTPGSYQPHWRGPDVPTWMGDGNSERAWLEHPYQSIASIISPSLLLSMTRFLLRCEGVLLRNDIYPDAIRRDASPLKPAGPRNGPACIPREQVLPFLFTAVAHACCFYRATTATECDASAIGEGSTSFCLFLGWAESLSVSLSLRTALDFCAVQDTVSVVPPSQVGEPFRLRAHQLCRAWSEDLVGKFHSPLSHVPSLVTLAAEEQWLLLKEFLPSPATTSLHEGVPTARLPLDESSERPISHNPCNSVKCRHEVPAAFTDALSGAVTHAFQLLVMRAELALHESTPAAWAASNATSKTTASAREDMTDELATGTDKREAHHGGAVVDEEALTQLQVTLSVQCVQFMHLLLRMHRVQLWCAPGSGPVSGNASSSVHAVPDDVVGDADERVLQAAVGLFTNPKALLDQLSSQGKIYYTVLWMADYLSTRLLRGSLIAYRAVLRALLCFFNDVGDVLMSSSVACADPRQTLLRFAGVLSRRLLGHGIQKLSSWRPVNATSIDVTHRVYDTLRVCMNLLQNLLVHAKQLNVLRYSEDRLVDIGNVREMLVSLLQGDGLLPRDEGFCVANSSLHITREGLLQHPARHIQDGVWKPQQHLPFLLPAIEEVGRILDMLRLVYHDSGASQALTSLLQVLFVRYRFQMADGILRMLSGSASFLARGEGFLRGADATRTTAGDGWGADASSTRQTEVMRQQGYLLEWITDQLLDGDRTDMPAMVPTLQCAVLSAVFHLLPWCEPRVSAKLAQVAFGFLSAKVVYTVRYHTAIQVHILFRHFADRGGCVLQELLFRARDGILSSNSMLCATSLLALAEAARAASWLEVRVVYTLLECWATRGFQHQYLIMNCLQLIAEADEDWQGRALESGGTSVAGKRGYVSLCRWNMRSLLYLWLWDFNHPIGALPVQCFGYDTLERLLVENVEIVLPIALMQSTSHFRDSEGGGYPGYQSRVALDSMGGVLLSPCELLDIIIEQSSHQGRTSSSPCTQLCTSEHSLEVADDITTSEMRHSASGTLLRLVLSYLPQVIAQLVIFICAVEQRRDHVPTIGSNTESQKKAEEEMQRAAECARTVLYWIHQVFEHTNGGVMLSHVRETWGSPVETSAHMMQRHTFLSTLLDSSVDALMNFLIDLHGTVIPLAEETVLLAAAQKLAANITDGQPLTSSLSKDILQVSHEAQRAHTLSVPVPSPLGTLLREKDGDVVYTLLQHLYAKLTNPVSTTARCAVYRVQSLALLDAICRIWIPKDMLTYPHVLRTIISICTHLLLQTSLTPEQLEEQRALVCDLLLYVWPAALSSFKDDAQRPEVVESCDTMLALTMLSLATEVPVVSSTWTTLCRSDPALQEKDWKLMCSRYNEAASQTSLAVYDVDCDETLSKADAADGTAGVTLRCGEIPSPQVLHKLRLLLPLLRNITRATGAPAVRYLRELCHVVDVERRGLVACILCAAKGDVHNHSTKAFVETLSAVCQEAMQTLLANAQPTGASDVPTSVHRGNGVTGTSSFTNLPVPNSTAYQVACLELLRALSCCFIEAGQWRVLQTPEVWSGGDMTGYLQTHSVGEYFVRSYAQYIERLLCLSYHMDAHVAVLASSTLREWMCECHGDASAPAQSLSTSQSAPLLRSAMEMYHSQELDVTVSEDTSNGQPHRTALHLRPFQRRIAAALRLHDAEVARAPSLDFENQLLWEELTVKANEQSFLPLFLVSAIHVYRLHHKYTALSAAIPLLYYEAQSAGANPALILHYVDSQRRLSRFGDGVAVSSSICWSEGLLPVILCHIMLLKESEVQRAKRAAWCEQLTNCLIRRSATFSRVTRMFLHSINMCRAVIMSVARTRGMKEFKASGMHDCGALQGSRSSALVSNSATPFGSVPLLSDMRDCYWLSDIPAIDLARAAVDVREPYLAALFVEISAESFDGPRGGIPSGLWYAGSVSPSPASTAFNSTLFPSATRVTGKGDKAGGPSVCCTHTRGRGKEEERAQKLDALVSAARSILCCSNTFLPVENHIGDSVELSGRGGQDGDTHVGDQVTSESSTLRGTCEDMLRHLEDDAGRVSLEEGVGLSAGMEGAKGITPGSAAARLCIRQARTLMRVGAERAALELLMGQKVGALGAYGIGHDVDPLFESHVDAVTARDVRDAVAEAAYRCSQWCQPAPNIASYTGSTDPRWRAMRFFDSSLVAARGSRASRGFHESVFYGLCALQRRSFVELYRQTGEARHVVLRQLHPTNWLSSVLAAEALREMEECADKVQQTGTEIGPPGAPPMWLQEALGDQSSSPGSSVPANELPYSQRVVLDSVRHCLCQLYRQEPWWRAWVLQSGRRALLARHAAVAHRWLCDYKRQEQLLVQRNRTHDVSGRGDGQIPDEDRIRLTLLYAQVQYALGRQHEAVLLLQAPSTRDRHASSGEELCSQLCPLRMPDVNAAARDPEVVRQLCTWYKEMQLAPLFQLVRDPFLSQASHADTTGTCSFQLARLCHLFARELSARWQTHAYQQLRESIGASKIARQELGRQLEATVLDKAQRSLLQHRIQSISRDVANEEAELRREMSHYALYRRSALNAYARYLYLAGPASDDALLATFGFVELWLHEDEALAEDVADRADQHSADRSASLVNATNEVLHKALRQTPTQCFLPLFAQLAAQLGSCKDESHLEVLVLRIAQSHPLETIWPLLALCNGQQFGHSLASTSMHAVDMVKVTVARGIVGKLKTLTVTPDAGGVGINRLVEHADLLSASCIQFAFHKCQSKPSIEQRIPPMYRLLNEVKDLCIPPPTLSPTRKVTILHYKPTFTTPGGINVPKVLQCCLSDGTVVKQLLKMNDDLRQDALIEQVFRLANALFAKDATTRPLSVYTYNVVPLAPTVGMLEWVDHTVPFAEYLAGGYTDGKESTSGAHERYFPGEPTTRECRKKFEEAGKKDKYEVLLSIYAEFTPAMHYFFMEHYFSPKEWFQRRHTYTKSVAASSMIGYVVGLGDRHGSNLLLHRHSAEMVHIDLGIAFDQNKLLAIPELVPFRLTRNVVDGLGVLGTEGGLKNWCVGALNVLRARRELLLTVLEAFIHDPLALWAVSVVPPRSLNSVDDGERGPGQVEGASAPPPPVHRRQKVTPADAQRTLARVSAKLSGYDSGEQLSAPTQVQKLILTAQSVENLSAMFGGWSPWL